jgi:syndecan 4
VCDNCPVDYNPFQEEVDSDGLGDACDNCPSKPNGPNGGTCISGSIGNACTVPGENTSECGDYGFCSMDQEDSYPPQKNSCGDACDCEGNFDYDGDVDVTDAIKFKTDYGRKNCNVSPVCKGDFTCDKDVDVSDAILFKKDYGRKNCPTCAVGEWCEYP